MIRETSSRHNLALTGILGWQDVRQAYRRSVVGPFWITAGMALQIAAMGIVFGLIFRTDLKNYLPFLAVSIILWGFVTSTLSESCSAFINAEGVIRQLRIPHAVHIFRVVWKNIIMLAHNIVLIPLVLLAVSHKIGFELLLFIPGFLLAAANISWMASLLALISTRFRDMQPIVNSFLTILFYVTPVMWYPNLLPNGTAHLLLGLNPFYHILQLLRLPLLGNMPTIENWGISFLMSSLGWASTILVFRKYKNKIAYWV